MDIFRVLAAARWRKDHSGIWRTISNSKISVEVILLFKQIYWFPVTIYPIKSIKLATVATWNCSKVLETADVRFPSSTEKKIFFCERYCRHQKILLWIMMFWYKKQITAFATQSHSQAQLFVRHLKPKRRCVALLHTTELKTKVIPIVLGHQYNWVASYGLCWIVITCSGSCYHQWF